MKPSILFYLFEQYNHKSDIVKGFIFILKAEPCFYLQHRQSLRRTRVEVWNVIVENLTNAKSYVYFKAGGTAILNGKVKVRNYELKNGDWVEIKD
jgi:hypothetical protein